VFEIKKIDRNNYDPSSYTETEEFVTQLQKSKDSDHYLLNNFYYTKRSKK